MEVNKLIMERQAVEFNPLSYVFPHLILCYTDCIAVYYPFIVIIIMKVIYIPTARTFLLSEWGNIDRIPRNAYILSLWVQ